MTRALDVDVEIGQIEVRPDALRDAAVGAVREREEVGLVQPADAVLVKEVGEVSLRWMCERVNTERFTRGRARLTSPPPNLADDRGWAARLRATASGSTVTRRPLATDRRRLSGRDRDPRRCRLR
jgi:hypothetical protein